MITDTTWAVILTIIFGTPVLAFLAGRFSKRK